MGPALDLALRRHRTPAPDLEKEALKQAKLGKKKVPPRAHSFGVVGGAVKQAKLGKKKVLPCAHVSESCLHAAELGEAGK